MIDFIALRSFKAFLILVLCFKNEIISVIKSWKQCVHLSSQNYLKMANGQIVKVLLHK